MSEFVQAAGDTGRVEVQQAAEKEGAIPRRKVYRRLSESLTDEQQRAQGMITQGIPIRDVGQQLGIHRGTVYRWLKVNPYFRAAYNAWQLEQQESCRAALVKAAEQGVKYVIANLQYDPKLAWRVIKELGILSRLKPMSVDPARVEMEIALEDHEEESLLLRRIDREVFDEKDLPAPRGDLSRLLRLKSEAESNSSRRWRPIFAEEETAGDKPDEPTQPEEMSRK